MFMMIVTLMLAVPPQGPLPPQAPRIGNECASLATIPRDAKRFEGTPWTQEIAVTNDKDRITRVRRADLELKWQVPGGMEGVQGWRVEKYRHVPDKVRSWIGDISVKNSLGYMQNNRGVKREYPVGTRFDEVLSTDKGVFEHRVAEKGEKGWKRYVAFTDESARPARYKGLEQSCASCHDKAGTGGYATGLVPGGDTIISDPLDWSLVAHVMEDGGNYAWERHDDGDVSEVVLMKDGRQVGAYRFKGTVYRSYDARKDEWGPVVEPPIKAPSSIDEVPRLRKPVSTFAQPSRSGRSC